MQKKLIALAIAGLSSAAFAQSNVTVYGAMDLTQEVAKASGATALNANTESRTRLTSNSSHIGFKGAESLGNGLTAVFQAEFSMGADTGGWSANGGSAFVAGNRDTYLGVAGSFGTVAAGTLTHPIRAMGAKVDFNPGASSAGFTGLFGQVLGAKTGSDERATNAVAYISPNFNGFTGVVAYVNGETALSAAQNGTGANAQSMKNKAWQVAGTYENGPLWVSLGYDKHTDPQAVLLLAGGLTNLLGAPTVAAIAGAAAAGYNDTLKITRAAAKYGFASGTTVSALWDSQKYNLHAGATTTEAKRNGYMLGVNQNFGANNVWLQYAVAKDLTGSICSIATATCGTSGAKQWTLGYSHSLSKRTMVHAMYSKVTNESTVGYDHYIGGVTPAAGADTTVYGVGLRHTF